MTYLNNVVKNSGAKRELNAEDFGINHNMRKEVHIAERCHHE